jgi:hypothetical protein
MVIPPAVATPLNHRAAARARPRVVETVFLEGAARLAPSDGVVGHIFRTAGEYGYFAGRFNAFTPTFRDPNLKRLNRALIAAHVGRQLHGR